jgi:hypothetical protein
MLHLSHLTYTAPITTRLCFTLTHSTTPRLCSPPQSLCRCVYKNRRLSSLRSSNHRQLPTRTCTPKFITPLTSNTSLENLTATMLSGTIRDRPVMDLLRYKIPKHLQSSKNSHMRWRTQRMIRETRTRRYISQISNPRKLSKHTPPIRRKFRIMFACPLISFLHFIFRSHHTCRSREW